MFEVVVGVFVVVVGVFVGVVGVFVVVLVVEKRCGVVGEVNKWGGIGKDDGGKEVGSWWLEGVWWLDEWLGVWLGEC